MVSQILQSRRITFTLAIFLLIVAGVLSVLSMKDDSVTRDELAHIVAGYSYLTQQDYRLNPEHPPLVKDLAALPLLFLDLNFPSSHWAWREAVNGQWNFGFSFLYESGNDPNQIAFLARLPMVFLFLFLGAFLFFWTKKIGGSIPALFVLTLFTFSPNFLAHGRLVNTDVAAALGMVISIYFYLKFLARPSLKNILITGIAISFALLVKFSALILIPFLVFLTFVYFLLRATDKRAIFIRYAPRVLIIGAITFLLIGIVYQLHILNYPTERQLQDSMEILHRWYGDEFQNISFSIAENPFLRPHAHYLLGILRTMGRVGLVTGEYFLGEVRASGFWYYFPVLYVFKVPLAFHFLSLLAFGIGIVKFRAFKEKFSGRKTRDWIVAHFVEFSMALFVLWYLSVAIVFNINIGIRHLLPIFPFLYILVALGLKRWIISIPVGLLLVWYIFSSLSTFPHYLAYYNELAGGSKNGYKIAVNSNYDWGQDLKRLQQWAEKKDIAKIYVDVDYIGEIGPKYYLGERYVSWKGSSWWKHWLDMQYDPDDFPRGNYLAVSANFLQGGYGAFEKDYAWLDEHELVGRAGRSIFIYYID